MSKSDYLNELINIELNAAEMYRMFSQIYEQDREFWWKLSIEEMNHASLLKSAHHYINLNIFPDELIIKNTDEITNINNHLEDIRIEFKKNPSRIKAFEIAIEIEDSASESHYDKIMTEQTDDKVLNVFKKLNRDDVDHLNRIKKYMSDNNI